MKQYILYNPLSGGGRTMEKIKACEALNDGSYENELLDITKIETPDAYKEITDRLEANDRIVICGGDGTLNHFINDSEGVEFKNDIYYFATGTGNDFLNDIADKPANGLLRFNDYMKDLPKVTVNGETKRFLNNASFGIDGYCCEVGDAMREAGEKNISYTSIAIKGLLGGFKRVKATVTVDGMTKSYKNVWLAPTMNGRYCGGGMMLAPAQDRKDPEHKVSLVVMHCPLKLKTLIVFPSIFKGEHVKHTEMVEAYKGHNIKVVFDKPTAMQIDGETIKGVTSYTVQA